MHSTCLFTHILIYNFCHQLTPEERFLMSELQVKPVHGNVISSHTLTSLPLGEFCNPPNATKTQLQLIKTLNYKGNEDSKRTVVNASNMRYNDEVLTLGYEKHACFIVPFFHTCSFQRSCILKSVGKGYGGI